MKLKRVISAVLALALSVSITACSSGTGNTEDKGNTSDSPESETLPTIDSMKLGTDYMDIKADLKVLTCKTDCVDSIFVDYIKEFQKLYPNINIKYEGITDYEKELATRITTKDWGDICFVPASITNKADLPTYFAPLGSQETLAKIYNWTDDKFYDGESYGLPCDGNAIGIVYNKRVWKEAGITDLPKTPDDFLADLKKIKDKNGDKVDPLYTNFAAQWTMTAWDAYIGGCATGDANYMNIVLPHVKDPFSKQSDMSGPYAVYYVLYQATKQNLIEKDPTTTDWEGSKSRMNKGEIATMALGTWAVSQIQAAGDNADDIGYMPFPITVNGKQYATVAGDYNYCVNVTSSKDNKIASMLYIKWLIEKSGYASSMGTISTVKSDPLPEVMSAFNGVDLVVDKPAKKGEESLLANINDESELSLNADYSHVASIVEAAEEGKKSLDDIMKEWNEKWTAAQKKYKAIQ